MTGALYSGCYSAGDNDDGAPAAEASGGAAGTSVGAAGEGSASGSQNTGGTIGGGTAGSGTGTAGSGGSTSTACGGPLTLDATGWVDITSNGCGIQGPWYWFKDDAGTVVSDAIAEVPPYRAGAGMCLAGSTIVDPEFLAYGATIGLNLSEAPDSPAAPYNASAHGIIGFEITLSGSWTQELRLGFPSSVPSTDTAPFVVVGNTGPGTYTAAIAAAMVPSSWTVPNAGETANPTSVAAIQLQISGGAANAPFDVCITSLAPIVAF